MLRRGKGRDGDGDSPSSSSPIPIRKPQRPPPPAQYGSETPPFDMHDDAFVEIAEDGSTSSNDSRKSYMEMFADLKAAAARDSQPVTKEHKLRPQKLRANVQRFSAALDPFMAFFGKVHALQTWDNPAATTLTISVYYVALYFRMLLPATFLTLLSLVMWEYLKANGFVTTEAKEEADEKDAGTLRDKMTYVAGIAQKVQNILGKLADNLEKIINLFTWKVPENSMVVVKVLGAILTAVLLLPFNWLCLIVQLLAPVKFFVIDAIYFHFPPLKAKYDSTYNFFLQLPRNRDLEEGRTFQPPIDPEDLDEGSPEKDRRRFLPTRRSPKPKRKVEELPAMLCDWLGCGRLEELVGNWHTLDLTSGSLLHARKGRLYLTNEHLCFVRGNGDKNSGSYSMKLSQLESVKRAKPLSFIPKGFALEVIAKKEDGTTKSHIFGALISRDEVHEAICKQAKLPIELPAEH